jgi:hypothetical protein
MDMKRREFVTLVGGAAVGVVSTQLLMTDDASTQRLPWAAARKLAREADIRAEVRDHDASVELFGRPPDSGFRFNSPRPALPPISTKPFRKSQTRVRMQRSYL